MNEQDYHDWKRNTPHEIYYCDRGCLHLRVNGAHIFIGNNKGRGDYPVYFVDGELPDQFAHAEPSFDGPAVVEVMSYDILMGEVLKRYELTETQSLFLYRDNEGAFAFKVN